MKFGFFGTPNCYHSERHGLSPALRCPTPAFLLKHLHFSWSTSLCLPACCGACSWEVAAEGACPVSLPSAEILLSCQRQNVTLFSSSCGCEKCESQDFASASGAAFRAGVTLVDSKQDWRKVCVLLPEHVWEFALSSGKLLKKITGPGKSYLSLMGCQWSLASQNYFSPSEKIQANSGPPTPDHGMIIIQFPAILCPAVAVNSHHIMLFEGGGQLVRWGKEEKRVGYTLRAAAGAVHPGTQQRGGCPHAVPISAGIVLPDW